MNEALKAELAELQNLQSQGSLDDTQTARLSELAKVQEEAEKTASEQKSKDLASAIAQKEHFRKKAEEAEAANKALEEKYNKRPISETTKPLDVEEIITVTTALEGLDSREKEYVVQQHKLTGKSLQEVRTGEDFGFWDSSYKQKVEKENSLLKPSGTQSTTDLPKSLDERLASASMEEKEKILTEGGFYKPPKIKTDRQNIGGMR